MFSYPKDEAELLKAPDSAFLLAVSTLHRVFEIPYSKSNSFYLIYNFYQSRSIDDHIHRQLSLLSESKHPRREVYNFMVSHHDINDVTLSYYFPTEDKRRQLNDYLDEKLNLLVA